MTNASWIVYDKRFLIWWGLLLFCLKLGSRRALDYQLRDTELPVLDNVNQLAKTQQETLPVHKTLDHFPGHAGSPALADLRNQCVRQLIRASLAASRISPSVYWTAFAISIWRRRFSIRLKDFKSGCSIQPEQALPAGSALQTAEPL